MIIYTVTCHKRGLLTISRINTYFIKLQEETGSNLVTVTCVDGLTMERAMVQPQKFDLVRNRMGGWTNFFVCMFDEHKKQHARRPVFGPHKK